MITNHVRNEIVYARWVIDHRWWLIIITGMLVLSAAFGLQFLTSTNDTRVFFSEDNPQLKALEDLENTYNKTDSVLFILAPKDGNTFTRETLSAVEMLTELAWQMPYSSRVDSVSNFQHTQVIEDDLIVESLIEDAINLSNIDIENIKNIALSEPQLVNALISESGHVTGIFVTFIKPGKALTEVTEISAYALKMLVQFRQQYPNINFYLTGSIIQENAFGEVSQDDMTNLIPIMFLVLIVLTGLTLRTLSGTFATVTVIVISMITGMGVAGWFGLVLTPASANAPVIILTLAVADSVHIIVMMSQLIREGQSKYNAIAESLRINFQPIFLTSITTAIGFLTMNFSDAPPFRDLGNIVCVGVMSAFFYSIFFLPSLLAVLPMRVEKRQLENIRPQCDRLASFVIGNHRYLLWASIIAITVISAGILRNEMNENFVKYFDHSFEFRNATDFLQENLTGWDTIEYSLSAGESAGINNPAYLIKVEEFANWFRQQPKVAHVTSFTDTVKRLNRDMHGGDEAWYRIPEQRDMAAQYLFLYEMSLPYGLDLNNKINIDKSATKLIAILRDTTTMEQRELDKKAQQWLKANAPESMFTYGSGLSMIWAHLSQRNIYSMLWASFGALALISAILIFALRSISIGLLSLIPNLAPAAMAFGVWGLLVGQIGLGLSVIVSMTLGIVVDDTVHFLSKYLRARREYNMDSQEAVRFSFNHVGTAIWITTAILAAGFLILTFSHYRMSAEMGLMSAITISLALLMDFILLPSLLMINKKIDIKKLPSCT